jgi:glutathione S-transferase
LTLTFYTNPMSRGQIARWMLEELGEPYEHVLLDYGTTMKAPEYLAVNPMGKVPAIKHGDTVVTEAAAICLYLADAFPDAELAPPPKQRGDYYRWILFASGPIEAAITNRAMGWQVPPDRKMMAGYGDYDDAVAALESAVAGKSFVAGGRFSAADVYVGSTIDWGLMFKTLPDRPAFQHYIAPMRERAAYKKAKAIDAALMPKQA